MFGSVVAQGQRGMKETVASREPGAKSEERRANSEQQGDLRNEKRRTPNVQRRSQYAAAAKVTGDPEVCGTRWSSEKISRWTRGRKLSVGGWPAGRRNWFSFLSEFMRHFGSTVINSI